jgi:NhaA family Na+:H+ antiporter
MSERPVALVFRYFPLRHLHQNAEKLAEVMQAIDDRKTFWAAHERLMALRHMSLEVAREALAELGLDWEKLSARSAEMALAVQADVDRGLKDGVHSTPSFFFNGAPHDGRYDLDTLREQLASAPVRVG